MLTISLFIVLIEWHSSMIQARKTTDRQGRLDIALEISCQHRLRLELSWCSSSRLHRNTDFTRIKGLEAGSNIRFYRAVLAPQALDGGISSMDTM
ncbi:hypothetical protein EDD22DRAFT_873597, partial [Suillus occidentalis]